MLKTQQQHAPALTEIGTAVRHSAVYGLGSMLTKALSFALLPFFTHYLDPADYGLIEILDLSVSLLGMVLNMGIANALLRTYAAASSASEKDKAVSTAFLFAGATGLVIFLCGLAFIRPVSTMLFGPAVPARYLLLSFSSFILAYVAGPFGIYLRAREASGWTVLLDSIFTLLVLVLNIFFVAGLKIGLFGILLSPVIVNGALLCLAGGAMLRLGLRFSGSLLREMVRFGLPLIFANLAAFVLNFSDRFFLKHFQSLEVVGLYAIGYKFGFMISVLLVQPFCVMWQSRMYAIYANKQHVSIFGQIFVLYSLMLTYAALAMALLSPEIVSIMAGPRFAPAGKVIPPISFAYVVWGVGSYLQTGLYLANRTNLIGAISAAAAVIGLALNCVLIFHYGMMGAAWATVLSFGVAALGNYWYSRTVCPLELDLGRVAAGGAVALGLFLPFQWWTPGPLAVAIAAKLLALAAFPVILRMFRVLSPAEIATVLATKDKTHAVYSRLVGSVFGRKPAYES